jgi:hypothetical protein
MRRSLKPTLVADSLLAPVRTLFRAIARTVVPEAEALDAGGWAELEGIVEAALALRPAAVRRQLLVFIRLLGVLPVFRYGRPFTALDPGPRARFLSAMESAPLLLLRRGFWGLRTLVFMGYYARPAAAEAIGYRAHLRGWQARPRQPAR